MVAHDDYARSHAKAGSRKRRLGPVLAYSGVVFLCAVAGSTFARATEDGRGTARGFRCAVIAEARGGASVISGRIFSDREISGRYRLAAVRQGAGSSSSTQSGDFRATPESPAVVGTIVLGGSGTTRVELTAHTDDEVVSCVLE